MRKGFVTPVALFIKTVKSSNPVLFKGMYILVLEVVSVISVAYNSSKTSIYRLLEFPVFYTLPPPPVLSVEVEKTTPN
jgi:hypothetical protein